MSRIALNGAAGRVSRSILALLLERGHTLAAAFEHPESPALGSKAGKLLQFDNVETVIEPINAASLANADGIIDFTSPSATLALLNEAVASGKPMVIGTTGLTPTQAEQISKAAQRIPVVFSPNMSVGVNLLFKLTELAAKTLGDRYDIEIIESHHRHKKDAPSGTAMKLLNVIKTSTPELANLNEVTGRCGLIGERKNGEIGMMAMRGGDIVGEHTVFFIGSGERLELTHRATNRENFAMGAVLALEFLLGRPPGLYSMFDVLGI